MSWIGLAISLLKIVADIVGWLRDQRAIDAARDKEIAKTALTLLELTEEGKALRARISAMTDTETEQLWKSMLED